MGDVLLPSQSYLARVPDAISVCTNEESIAKFRELAEQFNSGIMAGDFWSHVDAFGRNSFFKTMHAKYKSITQKSKSVSSSRSASGSSSPSNTGRRKKSPGAVKRKVMFDSTEPAGEDAAQEKPKQSTSKS